MQKKPFILIICVVVVIIAITLLVVYIAKGGSTDIQKDDGKKELTKSKINLSLSAYPEEETEGSVEISVIATVSDGNEIVSIKTPDGKTSGYTEDKKYTVDENGEYSFTVTASDGNTATETIKIENISKISADNPYIPDGFKHIEGTEVDTGFVVEDDNGNQYVWVPVEDGSLVRNTPSEKYFEDDNVASALNNSVAKYCGFYIARYEASKDNESGMIVAKSVEDAIPWSDISYDDAYDASKNTAVAYNYIGVKTALISSYAWDTALDWMDKTATNYSTSRSYGNYTNQILNTGATESDIINEIADMAGNLREWTTEKYDESVSSNSEDEENTVNNTTNENSNNSENKVNNTTDDESFDKDVVYRTVRGGSATMDKIANSRIGERTDLRDDYWGFRIVLYKE